MPTLHSNPSPVPVEVPSKDESAPTERIATADPERWVERHGDYLFKFAMARLRDAGAAEDLVQDTFFAALKGWQNFESRSAERSWLTGILKHRVARANEGCDA